MAGWPQVPEPSHPRSSWDRTVCFGVKQRPESLATMLNGHGRHALRPLIPEIVHERTDRHGSHPFAGERAQQGLQWLWFVLGWVKPLVERTWVENDRHPVMQRAHHVVGISASLRKCHFELKAPFDERNAPICPFRSTRVRLYCRRDAQ